jgi:hypothetical protein
MTIAESYPPIIAEGSNEETKQFSSTASLQLTGLESNEGSGPQGTIRLFPCVIIQKWTDKNCIRTEEGKETKGHIRRKSPAQTVSRKGKLLLCFVLESLKPRRHLCTGSLI